jgi:hypothetical protein
MKNKTRYILMGIFLTLFLALGSNSFATSYTSNVAANDKNWSDPNTWTPVGVPTILDDVTINDAYSINLDGDFTCKSLTISAAATLQPGNGNFTLTVAGDAADYVKMSDAAALINYTNTSYSGSRLSMAFGNAGGAVTTSADSKFNIWNLSIAGITTRAGAHIINIYNDMSLSGSGCYTSLDELNLYGALTLSGNSYVNFVAASTLTLSGTSTQLISSTSLNATPFTFGIVTVAATSTTTISNSFTENGALTVNAGGSFLHTSGTATLATGWALVNNGTLNFFNLTSSSAITTASSFTINGNLNVTTSLVASAGTISFDNLATKTITNTGTLTFYSLKVLDGSRVTTTKNFTVVGNGANVGIEVIGTGSFIASTPSIITMSATAAASTQYLVNSTAGTLELYALSTGVLTTNLVALSDMSIKGNVVFNAATKFNDPTAITVVPTATITFKGTSTISASAANANINFMGIKVADNSTLVTAATITGLNVYGDLSVLGNGSLTTDALTPVTFSGNTTKNITNNADLIFGGNFTVSTTASNIVTTNSSFRVNGLFAAGTDATTGAFIASGNSTIFLYSTGDSPSGSQYGLQFQNVQFEAAATPTSNIYSVKGDFVANAIVAPATAGTVYFIGSSIQTIKGAAVPKFINLVINNTSGLKLETSIGIDLATGALTLTNGYLDLNGNNSITFLNNAGTLTETAPYSVINNKTGNGSIISATDPAAAQSNSFGIPTADLTLSGTAPKIALLERFQNSVIINGKNTVKRYYRITLGAADNAIDAMSAIYNAQADQNNLDSTKFIILFGTSLTSLSTLTSTTNAVVSGSSKVKATVVTGVINITPIYFAIAEQEITISALPTSTSYPTANTLSTAPLTAGGTNAKILGFKVASNGGTTISQIIVNFNRAPGGTYSNIRLYSTPIATPAMTVAATLEATGVVSGNTVIFTGLSRALTPAVDSVYYIIYADVDNTVSAATPSIATSVNASSFTVTSGTVNPITISGTTFNFSGLDVAVTSDNTPAAGYLSKSGTDQAIFGFSLNNPTGGSSFNFNSVTLTVAFDNSADATNFSNYKLFEDANKNGIYDATDVTQFGSTISSLVGSTLTFSGVKSIVNTISNTQYVLVATVKGGAPTGGTIKVDIASPTLDVTVGTPGTITTSSRVEGSIMTVADSTTITKIVIKSVIADASVAANYGVPANTLVDGAKFTITAELQNANGYPVITSALKTLTITVAGSSVLTPVVVGTFDIAAGTSSLTKAYTLAIAGNIGEANVSLQAAFAGLTTGISPTLTIRALEPAESVTDISTTLVTSTGATVNWGIATTNKKSIIVIKQGSAPTLPSDGIDYNAAALYNFSTPALTNGTTGTGSVVVYKDLVAQVPAAYTAAITGLSPATTYYASMYTFSGLGTLTNFNLTALSTTLQVTTTSFTTKPATPAALATNLTFSNVTSNAMTLKWTRGNGAKCIVIATLGTAPTDKVTYTASSSYNDINAAFGATGFVVYNGTGNTVDVTNLMPNTSYTYYVWEYNGTAGNEEYPIAPSFLSAAKTTLVAEPTIQANNITVSEMTLGTNTTFKLNWVIGNGANRLLVIKEDSPISLSEYPLDAASVYTANLGYGLGTQIGDGFVALNGAGNTATITGLKYGHTYYFKVFEYNGTAGTTINFNTSDATGNPSSKVSDSYESNDLLANAKLMNADGSFYMGILSSATDVDWFYFTPDVVNGQGNIRVNLKNLPYNYNIELYNAAGRLLRSSKRTGTSDEIMVINNVPVGDYYIKIYSADGNYSLTPYRVGATTNSVEYMSVTP